MYKINKIENKVKEKKYHIKILVGESSLLDFEFSLLFLLPRLPLLPLLLRFYLPKYNFISSFVNIYSNLFIIMSRIFAYFPLFIKS